MYLCGREIFMLGLVCMLNEEWKQMSLWKLELGVVVSGGIWDFSDFPQIFKHFPTANQGA